MKKRSVSIAGHRTSISLEEEFWDLLVLAAGEEGCSIASLIAAIDRDRLTKDPAHNLSSAIRLFVLKRVQDKSIEQNS